MRFALSGFRAHILLLVLVLYASLLEPFSSAARAGRFENANSTSSSNSYLDGKNMALNPVLLLESQIDEDDLERIPDLAGAASAMQQGPNLFSGNPKHARATELGTDGNNISTSILESYYSGRAGVRLNQFGYQTFSPALVSENQSYKEPQGAMADDYVLGAGDEVNVLIRGQINFSKTIPLQRDGTLVVEDLAPIQAQGRKIKDVSDEIKKMIGDYYNSDVFLSVSKTRQISVMVSGQVIRPGPVFLSSLATLKEALIKAGGVSKDGTLRRIKILRGDTQLTIDLYGLLIYGSNNLAMGLRDGDVIHVDSIGPTIAISGDVKRPGIYEILPKFVRTTQSAKSRSQILTLDDLLSFSGGVIAPGMVRYIRRSPDEHGAELNSSVTDSAQKIFSDGDILWVGRSSDRTEISVELMGESRGSGIYALSEASDLKSLLPSDRVFGSQIYPLFAVIERWDSNNLTPVYIAFSPERVVNRTMNMPLKGGDRIYLFSKSEIGALSSATPITMEAFKTIIQPKNPETLLKFSNFVANEDHFQNLQNFIHDHMAYIRGAVGKEGSYPIADGISIASLISTAQGIKKEADLERIEVTRPAALKRDGSVIKGTEPERMIYALNQFSKNSKEKLITLHPGDTIRISQISPASGDAYVTIAGEVKSPGNYDLLPGDTLAILLDRAGGLTTDAYAEGTVFSRASERAREEQRYQNVARDLELRLSDSLVSHRLGKRTDTLTDEELTAARDLIADLKQSRAAGRITVQADPEMLKIHPDQDILLEKNDKIYIPKRPSHIRVAGEVQFPAALRFESGQGPNDYIDQAGGLTHDADPDHAFIVFPDGSASPLNDSLWSYRRILILPGSTIIVPRDPKPFNFIEDAKDITQILANLATSAIFADNLSSDD